MTEWVSISEFAKRKNIRLKAVQDGIKNGRIKLTKQKVGRPKINWDTENQEWEDNRDETQAYRSGNSVGIKDNHPAPSENSFAKAKAVRETLTAKILQLDYEEKTGKLVNADEVKVVWFNLARTIRDTLLNIPERISAELAAESDEFKVHKALQNEIYKVLEVLSHGQKE